ncbi:hypothetical protein POM88_022050 [Heracleum sosnowskyi]|uniref:Uncharacterized protein n=1 Tax=Heracleum sosnowskyi TaxID=360622 RepID=A0AAD8MPB7_9APIA|nr:hypothetical protein POM88_022050 [Heracleum sosnowskyi]
MVVKSKKQEDFATLEEYRSYFISTFTCLQQQPPPVFEQKPPVFEIPVEEINSMKKAQFLITEQQTHQQLVHDADEFQYKKLSLLNDSPPPSLLQLGLPYHPDAERPNDLYRPRQLMNSNELLHNSTCENAMVDEFFNFKECEKAICGPDKTMFLFPDISKTELFDDVTTMKYLIKYKLNVGPLPFSVYEPQPTQTHLDCLHAYIEAHLTTPSGRYISGVCLRTKLLKLRNMYKNLVAAGKCGKPIAQGFSMHICNLLVDLLKKTWE